MACGRGGEQNGKPPGMKQNHRGTRRPRFWAFIQKKEVTAHAVTRTRLVESRHVTRVRHQRTTVV